jgi:hypothetical protein
MQLKHLIQQFSYRIEPKPEGGFIARATDPTIPPLEAPTREELQEKIQEKLALALSEAFPGLKLPVQNRQLKFEVHIERKPGGGFAVHSAEPGTPVIEPATHEKIDHFAEELLGFVDKNFPELSKSIAARVESGTARTFANQATDGILNADSQSGSAQGLPQAQAIPSNCGNVDDVKFGNARTMQANFNDVGDVVANTPITPQVSSSWTIFRFLLALLIIAALMYVFLHRR